MRVSWFCLVTHRRRQATSPIQAHHNTAPSPPPQRQLQSIGRETAFALSVSVVVVTVRAGCVIYAVRMIYLSIPLVR